MVNSDTSLNPFGEILFSLYPIWLPMTHRDVWESQRGHRYSVGVGGLRVRLAVAVPLGLHLNGRPSHHRATRQLCDIIVCCPKVQNQLLFHAKLHINNMLCLVSYSCKSRKCVVSRVVYDSNDSILTFSRLQVNLL